MSARARTDGKDRQGGFTLLEILVAAMVVGVAVVSGTWAMSTTVSAKALLSEEAPTAALLAREIRELAVTLPRQPAGATGATNGSPLAALDALVGATFSPPIRANGTTDMSLAGWTQQVDLDVYDVNDLVAPRQDDPAQGIPEDGSRIYLLRVTILAGGEVDDSFRWWLVP